MEILRISTAVARNYDHQSLCPECLCPFKTVEFLSLHSGDACSDLIRLDCAIWAAQLVASYPHRASYWLQVILGLERRKQLTMDATDQSLVLCHIAMGDGFQALKLLYASEDCCAVRTSDSSKKQRNP